MSAPVTAAASARQGRRLLRALAVGAAVLVLALALAVPAALLLALEGSPRVLPRDDLSHADVARALAQLQAQDPRRRAEPGLRLLALGERDLDLVLNHVAHRWLGSAMDVRIERGLATVQASVELPAGRWLNLQLELADEAGRPVARTLRVGRLPLPAAWLQPAAAALARRHERGAEVLAVLAMVQRVSFFPDRLSVVYAWDGQAPGRVLAALVTADEQRRLEAYHRALAALPEAAAPRPVALGRLLPPLFALAARRSAGASAAEAAAENRALLLTVTLHATGRSLAPLVPAARDWPPLPAQRVTLSGRDDFALHFLISAVLAADTTSPLSRAVGIYKEVADSRGGSGFSFNDIAADRAGTRLGELALARPRELQARLAATQPAGIEDAALMPPWHDLPEFLPEAEFLRRYGGVGAPPYNRRLAEIDRRITALPLLRP